MATESLKIFERSFGLFAGPAPDDDVVFGPIGSVSAFVPTIGFYSQDFFTQPGETHWYSLLTEHRLSKDKLLSQLDTLNPHSYSSEFSLTLKQKSEFLETVEGLKSEFKSSPLKKVVPYAFANANSVPDRLNQLRIIAAGLKQQKLTGGYLFALCHAGAGLICLTPELLFQKRGSEIETMALAGTASVSEGAADRLLNDKKEVIEHQWVIKGIQSALEDLGSLTLGPVGVKQAGQLLHLKTQIRLQSAVATFADLVNRLHPTPALGGFPKERSTAWLANYNERFPRSRFGAPFGFRTDAVETCVVAIRGVEWSVGQNYFRMGAGCGITEKSDPENEWRELQFKLRSICHSLDLKVSEEK